MLEGSVFLESNGGVAASGSTAAAELRNEGGSGGAAEDGDRNSAGNRWPRDETLALLRIRSDMDLAFRDSSLKAPLWDEASRKLGELGYKRSAKKCKEKFENIYKYHRRTKDGRSSRQAGRNYRFFEQLELLNKQFSVPSTPLNQTPSYVMEPTTDVLPTPISCGQNFTMPCAYNQDGIAEFTSASTSTASSSGKESEGSVMKKRKIADYLERLMKDILEKQQDLQNTFLEAIEKCEKDRIAREEAWKAQEMARIQREQEFLDQERAIAAAKDAAVLAFLQKIAQQKTLPLPPQVPEILNPLLDKSSEKQGNILEKFSYLQQNSAADNFTHTSSSRWPKAEVEALIMLKTDLDLKYQDNGPKGPLWEEISSCMKKLGYDRSSKRCKEKWENINKYYKRVKESNKKRPQDSKTCPYFNMLESLYANKFSNSQLNSDNGGCNLKQHILMRMLGQNQQQPQAQLVVREYGDIDPQKQEDEADDDDDGGGGGYRIDANNLASVTTLG
ncbi:hypothetical protein OROMI_024160 [Orobanche minor]